MLLKRGAKDEIERFSILDKPPEYVPSLDSTNEDTGILSPNPTFKALISLLSLTVILSKSLIISTSILIKAFSACFTAFLLFNAMSAT